MPLPIINANTNANVMWFVIFVLYCTVLQCCIVLYRIASHCSTFLLAFISVLACALLYSTAILGQSRAFEVGR